MDTTIRPGDRQHPHGQHGDRCGAGGQRRPTRRSTCRACASTSCTPSATPQPTVVTAPADSGAAAASDLTPSSAGAVAHRAAGQPGRRQRQLRSQNRAGRHQHRAARAGHGHAAGRACCSTPSTSPSRRPARATFTTPATAHLPNVFGAAPGNEARYLSVRSHDRPPGHRRHRRPSRPTARP